MALQAQNFVSTRHIRRASLKDNFPATIFEIMKDYNNIPSHVLEMWEREAIDQKIPYTEFGNFLKMKQRQYEQRQSTKVSDPIFANAARNKLTDYGQKVALETLLALPLIERVIKFARFDLEDLQERLSHGFADESQKLSFIQDREHWFLRLKEKMKDFRISKEVLASNGLNWNVAKSFAYQTL